MPGIWGFAYQPLIGLDDELADSDVDCRYTSIEQCRLADLGWCEAMPD